MLEMILVDPVCLAKFILGYKDDGALFACDGPCLPVPLLYGVEHPHLLANYETAVAGTNVVVFLLPRAGSPGLVQ